MKREAKGQIHERISAIANAWYPAYIIQGDENNLMIDAGLNLLAPRYLASIRDILGDVRELHHLFLTHSHYDHIGSAWYLKQRVPGLNIGAHKRVAALVQKPSVLAVMNQLSLQHVEFSKHGLGGKDLTLQPFEVDSPLRQGDEFDLGRLTCRVYEIPGHTRDSLAFHFPEIKALFTGDGCGLLQGQTGSVVQVEFLASYGDYINSIQLMINLKPEIICLGHGYVLAHGDAADFLERSLAETFLYRELIEGYLKAAGGDIEEAIRKMAHDEYSMRGGIVQKPVAYLANLTAQVNHVAGLRKP